MYRLGIIEESLNDRNVLKELEPFFISRRTEAVPDDPCPLWHINEYHVPDHKIAAIAERLQMHVMPTWYIHAFSESNLIVVLTDAAFEMSLHRDDTWNKMIAYGERVAHVEHRYLESIPLHI